MKLTEDIDLDTVFLTLTHVHRHGCLTALGRGSVMTHLSQEVDGLARQQDLQSPWKH